MSNSEMKYLSRECFFFIIKFHCAHLHDFFMNTLLFLLIYNYKITRSPIRPHKPNHDLPEGVYVIGSARVLYFPVPVYVMLVVVKCSAAV